MDVPPRPDAYGVVASCVLGLAAASRSDWPWLVGYGVFVFVVVLLAFLLDKPKRKDDE